VAAAPAPAVAAAAAAGGGDADVAPTTGSNFMQDAISTHLNTPAGGEAQRNACKPFHWVLLLGHAWPAVVAVASMTNSLLPSFEWNSIPMQQGQQWRHSSNPRRLSHLVPFVCLLSADVAVAAAAAVAVAAAAAAAAAAGTAIQVLIVVGTLLRI